jgi:hypothetical protein
VGGGGAWSRIIRTQESLGLYKSFPLIPVTYPIDLVSSSFDTYWADRQWQIWQPETQFELNPLLSILCVAIKAYCYCGRFSLFCTACLFHKGVIVIIVYIVKTLNIMCVVYLLFLNFLGTLPCGVHFLICVHPKRRKAKFKMCT